jgi:hypothetical protein
MQTYGVYLIDGVSGVDHQYDSAARNRSAKVTANAFNAGFVRREALLF